MSIRRITSSLIPVVGAVGAAAGYAKPANADVSAAVIILLDRSGSMASLAAPGACPLTPGDTAAHRKWECAVKRVQDLASTNDPAWAQPENSTRTYFYWTFDTLNWPAYIQKEGPMTASVIKTRLGAAMGEGPMIDDSATPLAGAYCDAVASLNDYRNGLALFELPLYIMMGTDGLENYTPAAHACYGTSSPTAYVPPALDISTGQPRITRTDTIPSTITFVDGLTVPSWQSNMLDVAITNTVHTPTQQDAFFVNGKSTIDLITFIEDPIAGTVVAAPSAPGPDGMSAGRMYAAAPGFGLNDYLTFMGGLAEATGGRASRVGSGAPAPAGDPMAIHTVTGDANDSGCVDTADYNLIHALYGHKVSASEPDTYRADVNMDGTIDGMDYRVRQGSLGRRMPDAAPASAHLPQAVLGFEDLAAWSGASFTMSTSPKTEGTIALRVNGTGWRNVRSVAFNTEAFKNVTSKLAFDIYVPVHVRRDEHASLFVSCPSAGINDVYLGAFELGSAPQGVFSTPGFLISSRLKSAMLSSHSDFSIKIALDARDSGYILDNIRSVYTQCEDVKTWTASDLWTDYHVGDKRVGSNKHLYVCHDTAWSYIDPTDPRFGSLGWTDKGPC